MGDSIGWNALGVDALPFGTSEDAERAGLHEEGGADDRDRKPEHGVDDHGECRGGGAVRSEAVSPRT